MRIHKEGLKIIPVAIVILIVLNFLFFQLIGSHWLTYVLLAASVVIAVLVVYFFRVPHRTINQNINNVLAPADGKVVEIKEVKENEYFNDQRIQVSIFMSPLNVHQNRAPVGGIISYLNHKKGHKYPAFVEKSSELNERCSTVFKADDGTEIMSRQIAGTVARRICTYVKPGDKVQQGAEYGFIRFGSRVDVFIPLNASVLLKIGDRPVAGKTVLATI
ncbi:MAG: phosphatidylserine decarboxylase family protein [Draconibacterium sp.]|nr:MAG: phosphatidylserine decarboxylase family protein [Draconibacterium sp.]